MKTVLVISANVKNVNVVNLNMTTEEIWEKYGDDIYFFILSRVKDRVVADDVFQNVFLKIHNNIQALKDAQKAKSWVFQISRNEIANYYNEVPKTLESQDLIVLEKYEDVCCCFNKFMNELPKIYKDVIHMIYIEGHQQNEVAEQLDISLANVKARVRRGKEILKKNFKSCCHYEFNKSGKLVGDPDCLSCE